MFLRIDLLAPKKLIGRSMRMSLVNNKTQPLWQKFMTCRSQIINSVGPDLYSIQVYDNLLDVRNFNPAHEFTKWAATEVVDFSNVPEGMEILELSGGTYAVFLHQGSLSEFQKTFQNIFAEWLPSTQYHLDHRPHFEVLGEKYKNNHPDSEEEVWIPVK